MVKKLILKLVIDIALNKLKQTQELDCNVLLGWGK